MRPRPAVVLGNQRRVEIFLDLAFRRAGRLDFGNKTYRLVSVSYRIEKPSRRCTFRDDGLQDVKRDFGLCPLDVFATLGENVLQNVHGAWLASASCCSLAF